MCFRRVRLRTVLFHWFKYACFCQYCCVSAFRPHKVACQSLRVMGCNFLLASRGNSRGCYPGRPAPAPSPLENILSSPLPSFSSSSSSTSTISTIFTSSICHPSTPSPFPLLLPFPCLLASSSSSCPYSHLTWEDHSTHFSFLTPTCFFIYTKMPFQGLWYLPLVLVYSLPHHQGSYCSLGIVGSLSTGGGKGMLGHDEWNWHRTQESWPPLALASAICDRSWDLLSLSCLTQPSNI